MAALHARRGEYEKARNAAGAFFTPLRAGEQVERARAAPASRDDIITPLARNDPARADRLAVYLRRLPQRARGQRGRPETAAP